MPLLHPALVHLPIVPAACLSDDPGRVPLPVLRDLTAALSATPEVWRPVIQHRPDARWYTRLVLSATVEVWLIGWYPGQQTEIHDHGGALGALTVAQGCVEEDRYDRSWTISQVRRHATGAAVGFGAAHVHRVANRSPEIATTIHAYSPPELPMRFGPASTGGSHEGGEDLVELSGTMLGPSRGIPAPAGSPAGSPAGTRV